jgi:addiction module RelE/StbE family toxin
LTVHFSPEADSQLRSIADYIAREASEEVAEKVVYGITIAAYRLADFPHIGRTTDIPNVRQLVVNPYVVTYKVHMERIEIVLVRHGAQEPLL